MTHRVLFSLLFFFFSLFYWTQQCWPLAIDSVPLTPKVTSRLSELSASSLKRTVKLLTFIPLSAESRRDQEEGGELDSHEEASPEETKSREVELGYGGRVGLLLLHLFPNGGATDIVFVTLFCIAVGTVRWSLRNAGRTLP